MVKNKINPSDFPELLRTEISRGLPGTEVQWQMASSDRMMLNFPRTPGPDAIPASVLVLLYPDGNSVFTVLQQRPEYNGVHGGQISFPGGKQEPGDKDAVQTALREAHEETGIDPALVDIIGLLTPLFIPVSNMIVTPVVGWSGSKPEFRHHTGEVVFLFDAELSRFLDNTIVKSKPMQVLSGKLQVKYFDYDGHTIWGATAMILHELLVILKRGGLLES